MAAIAGRFGEFWASFNYSGGPPLTTFESVTAGATSGLTFNNPTTATPVIPGIVEPLCSLVDVSVSGNVDELETTVHNDCTFTAGASGGTGVAPTHGTARTYISNFHDETADVSCRYDEADECQEYLLIAAFNSLLFHFWYIPDSSTSVLLGTQKVIWGDAFSTSFSPSSPLDDTTSVDFSFRLSGSQYATMSAAVD